MGATNRLVSEAKVRLEASIPWLLVRVGSDMVTMGNRWWALAMMVLDIPMVMAVMMEELDMGIDLTCIPLGWVRVKVGWDGVLQKVGGRGQGGVGGLHPGGFGEGEVGPVGSTGPT